jgi:purine-nucleoside phosphorylase
MIIDDHINLMGTNPLIRSPNDDRFGPVSRHERSLFSTAEKNCRRRSANTRVVCVALGVCRRPGTKLRNAGGNEFFRKIGADAIGMSTVPEAIAARHMGMEILGISCITMRRRAWASADRA